jgi:hypothetical protein
VGSFDEVGVEVMKSRSCCWRLSILLAARS